MLGEALREAYHDLFLITNNPKDSDREAIEGKFKSFHNASDNSAKNMAATFFALLKIADVTANKSPLNGGLENEGHKFDPPTGVAAQNPILSNTLPTFHYNIQVHLPATKDPEVYNAIFRSLREHFVER